MSSQLLNAYIEEYSPKSFVVRGNTMQIKDNLKSMGGKWTNGLTDKESGEKFGAWLFWNAKKPEIEQFLIKKPECFTSLIFLIYIKFLRELE